MLVPALSCRAIPHFCWFPRRELALRYMENRNYSLQRVGMMLGYTVPTSFTRWFCAEFGCAPREWRNRNKQLASDSFT